MPSTALPAAARTPLGAVLGAAAGSGPISAAAALDATEGRGFAVYSKLGDMKKKRFPPTMTVGEVTAVARKLLKVPASATVVAVRYVEPAELIAKSAEERGDATLQGAAAQSWEMELAEALQSLEHYSVQQGGEIVFIVSE